MIQLVLVERITGRVAHQMVDTPVPQVMEEIMAVVEEEKLVTTERVQQRTVGNAPVSQILEETVEVGSFVAQERVQWIDEQMVVVRIPRITEEIGEEIVDVPIPPVDATEALQLQVCAMPNEIQE